MCPSADPDRGTVLDVEFHDAIRSIAASPKLNQTANLVYPVIERVRNFYLREGNEPEQLAGVKNNHCAVGEAILACDAEHAEALMRGLFADRVANNVWLVTRWVSPLRRSF